MHKGFVYCADSLKANINKVVSTDAVQFVTNSLFLFKSTMMECRARTKAKLPEFVGFFSPLIHSSERKCLLNYLLSELFLLTRPWVGKSWGHQSLVVWAQMSLRIIAERAAMCLLAFRAPKDVTTFLSPCLHLLCVSSGVVQRCVFMCVWGLSVTKDPTAFSEVGRIPCGSMFFDRCFVLWEALSCGGSSSQQRLHKSLGTQSCCKSKSYS